jgi:hypothetical protein
VTNSTEETRLAEITLRLVWAGADIHALDFLRWLVQNGRDPEWQNVDASTDNGVSEAFFLSP